MHERARVCATVVRSMRENVLRDPREERAHATIALVNVVVEIWRKCETVMI